MSKLENMYQELKELRENGAEPEDIAYLIQEIQRETQRQKEVA